MDRLVARREVYGDVGVHGVHRLLRALDGWCALRSAPVQLVRLPARCANPVHLDAEVRVREQEGGEGWVRLAGECEGLSVLQAEIAWQARASQDPALPAAEPAALRTPEAPTFAE